MATSLIQAIGDKIFSPDIEQNAAPERSFSIQDIPTCLGKQGQWEVIASISQEKIQGELHRIYEEVKKSHPLISPPSDFFCRETEGNYRYSPAQVGPAFNKLVLLSINKEGLNVGLKKGLAQFRDELNGSSQSERGLIRRHKTLCARLVTSDRSLEVTKAATSKEGIIKDILTYSFVFGVITTVAHQVYTKLGDQIDNVNLYRSVYDEQAQKRGLCALTGQPISTKVVDELIKPAVGAAVATSALGASIAIYLSHPNQVNIEPFCKEPIPKMDMDDATLDQLADSDLQQAYRRWDAVVVDAGKRIEKAELREEELEIETVDLAALPSYNETLRTIITFGPGVLACSSVGILALILLTRAYHKIKPPIALTEKWTRRANAALDKDLSAGKIVQCQKPSAEIVGSPDLATSADEFERPVESTTTEATRLPEDSASRISAAPTARQALINSARAIALFLDTPTPSPVGAKSKIAIPAALSSNGATATAAGVVPGAIGVPVVAPVLVPVY